MLITTCTHCTARFRVTPQQLNAKQGKVRCGRCRNVFNGFESLERFPDDDTGSRLLARAERRAAQAPLPAAAPPPEDLPDIETLPDEEAPPAPLEPPPRARPLARPDLVLPPPPRREPPARAWAFGAALLALVLAAELVYGFRSTLAQRYPVLRPWLETACASAGCTVAWARDDALLKLEDSELLEVPGKPGEIALGARIRNLAPVPQEYPHLELTLTDLTGQAAVRRVLRPTDYLGRRLSGAEVLAPGAEMSLQLRLETPRVKATGYELLLFYP